MDIDIDFPKRENALKHFKHIQASRRENGELKPHQTGIYVQSVPTDILTNRSTIEYKEAESRGYFKVDFLSASVYDGIRDEGHLVSLMRDPDWSLFEQASIVNQLFHLKGHHIITKTMKPSSVEELAACIAIIRPGKKHLFGKPWNDVFAEVWLDSGDDGYFFKKSHAVAYAMAIIVQLNFISEAAVPSG